ncbi:oocyte zinc finger protein XlCOF6.1-like isoform X1 [Corythoichthys intestinalis]|uniref:oocyte zinc finger protein XlCOF6.1-like isoform X1 n=1 Tax=Corythoichthys intestinalis TaxID=161448 RepID=UPI0025A66C3C|nr:oocyte zinc finger protein XlCOF6.1-like isoform X1 [Corythoichthys intestinalis]
MPYIKQEAEPEIWSIKEEQEDEIPTFPVTVSVKNEEDEGPSKESRAAKPSSDSSFQHLTTKGEGRSQPDDVIVEDLHPGKHNPPHVKLEKSDMTNIKQEAEPETPSIKEEKQEEEICKFPMTVRVKIEEDEGPSEESRATKLASSSLFQHLRTEGEGRSQPDDLLPPFSDRDDVTSHSSDYNTDKEDVDFEQNASKSLNNSSLKTDQKECVGGKPFSCSHCDKTFTAKEYLLIHTHTHTRGKPFVCAFCGKRFIHKGSLNLHERIHTGEKPFVCTFCGKRFCSKPELTRHTMTHTGDKPFVCAFCGKRFTHKGSLNVHKRTHTGEKPFVCSLCDKRFSSKRSLTPHMRTHTGEKPFVCTFCDKNFYSKAELTRHTRTHTEEKPFVCYVCDKGFFRKHLLTQHTRTHTAEKSFVCSICDRRISTKSALARHMQTHQA